MRRVGDEVALLAHRSTRRLERALCEQVADATAKRSETERGQPDARAQRIRLVVVAVDVDGGDQILLVLFVGAELLGRGDVAMVVVGELLELDIARAAGTLGQRAQRRLDARVVGQRTRRTISEAHHPRVVVEVGLAGVEGKQHRRVLFHDVAFGRSQQSIAPGVDRVQRDDPDRERGQQRVDRGELDANLAQIHGRPTSSSTVLVSW